ncbi:MULTISPECIES: 16S rRNA (cytosine(1402)-N(4))-methyltransferase RsmH [Exiguobacterium]|uniref:Ribosomal RNA small subunit methyltransferase H n=1 Tax=Exiguobacterium oxidotolerans TaxID=223958 RepID=A0A653ICN1_9BACL|nr:MULTISPECIES: 16S rRNA (cytosine(1402)-N(4))-methyltransferase RsmH [Exiguobacterium]ASI35830.1 16S rRNA (cytosine(1402)-N(4))-methyltransferase [Exiguobacterium sp. N4-1P]VWX36805.1 16S rRNA m4C1402 methyltransferase [Exiguobacterium oxidotolerans]
MFEHETVLKWESIKGLDIKPDGVYVDCTLGGAGHSEEIVKQLTTGHLYAFDQDDVALAHAEERLAAYAGRFTLIKSNFVHLQEKLNELGVTKVDGILFDLGVSSPQLDEGERGFSYNFDARLDMRMDQTSSLSAYEVVNDWPYNDLVRIFFTYGEEKFSKQIARKIEKAREEGPITTTFELVELIKDAIPAPARRKGGHPAKRTFQAIRIAVNDELNVFDRAVYQAIDLLAVGGRLCVITFHSLEDRMCKLAFKEKSSLPELPQGLPMIPKEFEPELRLVTRKPITAGNDELDDNRRSRSAKLRIVEKMKES